MTRRSRWAAALFAALLLAVSCARPDPSAWRAADAARAARTRERIAALPDAGRLALAAAERAAIVADSLLEGGEAPAAADSFARSLDLRQQWLGAGDQVTLESQSGLARALLLAGDMARALALDRRTLEARRALLGERHPQVAESLDQLAIDQKATGDSREESLALAEHAYALRCALLGPDSEPALRTLLHIGNIHRVARHPEPALAVFQRVLDASRGAGALDRERRADALFAMAMTVTPRGEWARAEPWLEGAVSQWRLAGSSQRASLAKALGAEGLALRHLGRLPEAEVALRESAQDFEELRRAAPPGWSRAVLYPLVSYDLLAAVQLEQGRGAEAWVSVERGLARALLEDLHAAGAIDTSGWWNEALARVQGSLTPGTAIVGWLTVRAGAAREEYPYWCYCIRARGPVHWKRVGAPPGGGKPADGDLVALRTELVRAASWPLRVDDGPELRELERRAYAARVQPLEPWLDGVRRLVVLSPDFVEGAPVGAMRDSNGVRCGERYVISYAPSALLHAHAQAIERAEPVRWRALLVGDPAAPAMSAAGAPPLAAARDEVSELAARFPAHTLLVGSDASMARVDALAAADALAGYSLVHLATHAVANERWSTDPAFALAGEQGQPGRMTAGHILATWRLAADLVTLAGCDTGIGPASKTDGMMGLELALLGAGARQVLVSLWAVDDRATGMLLGRFYDRLLADPRGMAAAPAALAGAQAWLRDWRAPDGSRPYAHPVYWAGFLLMEGGAPGKRPPHAGIAR